MIGYKEMAVIELLQAIWVTGNGSISWQNTNGGFIFKKKKSN